MTQNEKARPCFRMTGQLELSVRDYRPQNGPRGTLVPQGWNSIVVLESEKLRYRIWPSGFQSLRCGYGAVVKWLSLTRKIADEGEEPLGRFGERQRDQQPKRQ